MAAANDDKVCTTIRASRSTYYLVLLLWLLPGGVSVAAALQRSSIQSLWEMVALVTAYGFLLLVWVSRFRIDFGNGKVGYSTLFGGYREIKTKDIDVVMHAVGIRQYSDRFLPPIRLEVIPKPGAKAKKLVINAKVFDRSSIDALQVYLEAATDMLRH